MKTGNVWVILLTKNTPDMSDPFTFYYYWRKWNQELGREWWSFSPGTSQHNFAYLIQVMEFEASVPMDVVCWERQPTIGPIPSCIFLLDMRRMQGTDCPLPRPFLRIVFVGSNLTEWNNIFPRQRVDSLLLMIKVVDSRSSVVSPITQLSCVCRPTYITSLGLGRHGESE